MYAIRSYYVAYLVGIDMPAYIERPACIGMLTPGSEAESSGFKAGDCILRINGDKIESWAEANRALISYAGFSLDILVQRGPEQQLLKMKPKDGGLEGLQSLGVLPVQDAVVGALARNNFV